MGNWRTYFYCEQLSGVKKITVALEKYKDFVKQTEKFCSVCYIREIQVWEYIKQVCKGRYQRKIASYRCVIGDKGLQGYQTGIYRDRQVCNVCQNRCINGSKGTKRNVNI